MVGLSPHVRFLSSQSPTRGIVHWNAPIVQQIRIHFQAILRTFFATADFAPKPPPICENLLPRGRRKRP